MTDQDKINAVIAHLEDESAMGLLAMWVLKVAKDNRETHPRYNEPIHIGHAIAALLAKNGFHR